NPIEPGTTVLRRRDLVRADVDGANLTRRTDALRHLTGKISTTATELQHPFTGPQIERRDDRTTPDNQVVRFGNGLLKASHIAGKRQPAHDASRTVRLTC